MEVLAIILNFISRKRNVPDDEIVLVVGERALLLLLLLLLLLESVDEEIWEVEVPVWLC